jgi:hypothetical protein
MRYAAAAILLIYGLACLIWPGKVFHAMQGGFRTTVSDSYVKGSILVIRLVGGAILIGVPCLFLFGPAR